MYIVYSYIWQKSLAILPRAILRKKPTIYKPPNDNQLECKID